MIKTTPLLTSCEVLAAGFGAMLTHEMVTILQSQGRYEEKEFIKDAICKALWAGTRNTRAFYKMLVESLGHDNPSKNQDDITTGSKKETAMGTESKQTKNEQTAFKGGGKMSPAEYRARVNILYLKLVDELLFDEGGIIVVTAISRQRKNWATMPTLKQSWSANLKMKH